MPSILIVYDYSCIQTHLGEEQGQLEVMESVEQAKLQRFTTKENIGPAVSRSDTTHSQRGRSIRRLGHFLILLLIVRLAFGVKSWWHSPAALFAEPRHGDGRSRGMNSKPGLHNTAMMEPFNWTDVSEAIT